MAENTKIEWADHTFNPWTGCTKVSPACDHCYAERWAKRSGVVQWGPHAQRRRTSDANWRQPIKWARRAFVACPACGWRGMHTALRHESGSHFCPACGNDEWRLARMRVFCASLADVFDNAAPPEWRADLLHLIADTPHLDWLLLTKRIGNAHAMLSEAAARNCMPRWGSEMFSNVWIGATICNQEEADRDVPKLLAVPARVRFLSIEPMLGDIRLGSWLQRSPSAAFAAGKVTSCMPDWTRIGSASIDWVICGGESGPGARPMHPDWARSLRDQCQAAGVRFFFKQWGEWGPSHLSNDGRPWFVPDSHRWPIEAGEPEGGVWSYRVGKKAAGRLLDGRTWDEVPT